MFKKLLSVLLVAGLLLASAPCYAQARYSLSRATCETSTASLITGPVWVHGLSIFADAANSFAGVYDVATLYDTSTSNLRDEIGEATQYDRCEIMYDDPVYYSTAVTVVMTTGVLTVYYGPRHL